jgi:hypothetical protein
MSSPPFVPDRAEPHKTTTPRTGDEQLRNESEVQALRERICEGVSIAAAVGPRPRKDDGALHIDWQLRG